MVELPVHKSAFLPKPLTLFIVAPMHRYVYWTHYKYICVNSYKQPSLDCNIICCLLLPQHFRCAIKLVNWYILIPVPRAKIVCNIHREQRYLRSEMQVILICSKSNFSNFNPVYTKMHKHLLHQTIFIRYTMKYILTWVHLRSQMSIYFLL